MSMSLNQLLIQLEQQPEQVEFDVVMSVINTHFDYTPSRFSNGPDVLNNAASNEGSCKIFAFGGLMKLNKEQTLACFGAFYREDVLQNPQGEDHANIRAFMQHGWKGIKFDSVALKQK